LLLRDRKRSCCVIGHAQMILSSRPIRKLFVCQNTSRVVACGQGESDFQGLTQPSLNDGTGGVWAWIEHQIDTHQRVRKPYQ
jgi:hypothetical protein